MNKYIFLIVINLAYCSVCNAASIDTNSIFQSKLQPQIKIPTDYKIYPVNNAKEVYQAISNAHKNDGFAVVLFNDGIYQLNRTLNITANNIMFLSQSGNPKNIILRGNGMKATKGVDNLIRIAGHNFVLDGLTLERSGNHLIQIAGEVGANFPIIRNSILQDGYEQLIKVTYSRKHSEGFSNKGIIENCLFRYTAGVGPNYYIGGIDAHGIKNWVIKSNIFENIASPSKHIAEHAIHLWNDTAINTVENNLIINSDRGIGFGMRKHKTNYVNHSNSAGIIQGNIIYHAKNNHQFSDVGIILEDSPNSVIKDNIIYFEHKYNNAIEFRFNKTTNVLIKNNKTNRAIRQRDNAQGLVINNEVSKLSKSDLIDAITKFTR